MMMMSLLLIPRSQFFFKFPESPEHPNIPSRTFWRANHDTHRVYPPDPVPKNNFSRSNRVCAYVSVFVFKHKNSCNSACSPAKG